jgi:hypothetical protein
MNRRTALLIVILALITVKPLTDLHRAYHQEWRRVNAIKEIE